MPQIVTDLFIFPFRISSVTALQLQYYRFSKANRTYTAMAFTDLKLASEQEHFPLFLRENHANLF